MIKAFFSVFRFQGNLLLNFKIVITLFILLVLTLGFVQNGISDCKETLEGKGLFQDFEKKKVEQFFNYRVYGLRGFRILFLPDPISIFFINSVAISDMKAFADSSEQLNIYKSLNNKTVFELRKNWFTDYSGIFLLIGTLLCLFYGFQSLKHLEFLRFLASITSPKKLFWNIFFARGLLIFLILLVFMGCSILLAGLNGFTIPIDKYVLSFLLICFGMLMLTFSVGFFCGTIKSKLPGILCALLIWAVFIFFIPTLQNIITAGNANSMTPVYQLEMEKLTIFMNWEKMMLEKEGIVKLGEKASKSFKNRMLEFKQNELKKLQKMEEEQIAQLDSNKQVYQLISIFFPTTFYQSVNNEISSRGFNNLVDFCKFALKQKLEFIGLIIEKEYFSNYSKVEQFNAGNGNIYKANPSLPEYFLLGIIFNLLWIAALLVPSYFRFKKNLFELPENKEDTQKHYDVVLQSKSFKSWNIFSALFFKQMYNILSNEIAELKKKGYDLDVYFDGQELNTVNKKQNFFALCHPTQIPGYLNVIHFIEMMMDLLNVDKAKRKEIQSRYSLTSFRSKCFRQLDMNELGQVFLAILDMKIFDIYLLNDIARDMSTDFCIALKDRMDALCESGASVLFLYSSTEYLVFKNSKPSKYFAELYHWYNVVEDLKARNDDETTEC